MIFLWLSAASWAYFCVRQFVSMARIGFSTKKYPSSYDIPDYEHIQELVDRMGVKLDKKHPFTLKLGLDNAYSDPVMRRVFLGDALLGKLETQERMALISHELAHLKGYHNIKRILPFFALYIPLVFTLPREQDVVFGAVWIAFFMILFPHISRRFEYEADARAVREIGPEANISLLKKAETEEGQDCETVTHPSIQSRIKRIEKLLKRQQQSLPTDA
jgi:Zn-dependent protease with chaperone function